MTIENKLAKQYIKKYKTSSLLTIITIVLSTLLIMGISSLSYSLQQSHLYSIEQIYSSMHGSFNNVNLEKQEIISTHPDFEQVGYKYDVGYSLLENLTVYIKYLDENAFSLNILYLCLFYQRKPYNLKNRDGNNRNYETIQRARFEILLMI